jgi:hypothetical protein
MREVIVDAFNKYLGMFTSPTEIPEKWKDFDLGWVGTVDNLRYVSVKFAAMVRL